MRRKKGTKPRKKGRGEGRKSKKARKLRKEAKEESQRKI